MHGSWREGVRESALGGLVGGAVPGVLEAVRLVVAGRLGAGPVAVAALVGSGAISGALVGTLGGGLVGAALGRRGPGRTAAALVGAGWTGAVIVALAAWMPPPGSPSAEGPPFLHILGVLLGLVVAVGGPVLLYGGLKGRAALGALLVGIGVGAVSLGRPPTPAIQRSGPERPNVLLVTIDGARADRFGDVRVETPAFDRLVSEGARFRTAVAPAAASRSSHGALLTGVPSWARDDGRLPEEAITLAERFQEAGYATAAFVSSREVGRSSSLDQGFTVYQDDFATVLGIGHVLPGRLWALVTGSLPGAAEERRSDRTIDRAIRWLGATPGAWFAWVHLADPLPPFAPPPPWDERYYQGQDPRDPGGAPLRGLTLPAAVLASEVGITDLDYLVARYDGEVGWADAQADRLLDWLDGAGRATTTLVVLAGSHGMALGEEGEWFTGDGPGVAVVPLAMRLPGRVPAGESVAPPVELGDVGPTILDYSGLPPLDGVAGLSLRPTVEGEGIARRAGRMVTGTAEDRVVGLRFKGVWYEYHPDGVDRVVLYPTEALAWEWSEERLLLLREQALITLGDASPAAPAEGDAALLRSLTVPTGR